MKSSLLPRTARCVGRRVGRHIGHSIAALVLGAGLCLTPATILQSLHATASAAVEPLVASPIADAVAKANASIAKIVAIPDAQRTFDNTIGAIDDLYAQFEKDTSMLVFLSNVSPDAALRDKSQQAEQDATTFGIELGKREDLYNAVMAYAKTKPKLEGEQARLLEFILRDYKRSGMTLPKDKRDKVAGIQKEISKLSIDFQKNIAEDDTTVFATADELKGVPADMLAALPQSGDTYFIGMAAPTYVPVMTTCEIESTRQKLWLANKRRGGQKNVDILEKILVLRAQAANMLGYDSTAAYEAEPRMAKNVKNITDFYDKLRPLVRKKAQLDRDEFLAAKRKQTGNDKAELQPWDAFFIKDQLLKSKYAVDEQTVREYFPVDAVIDGLFRVTQTIYGLEYKDITAKASTPDRPLWHPEAKLYQVTDKASGKVLGEFYMDLYPRENKYTHFAQWSLVPHKLWADGTEWKPLAALVCNFPRATEGKPALLSHEDVETFFHEFGHCLHTIVSEAKYNRFSGTNVELDFVEAPSQMFENWVWDADVLALFARHYKTGEKLPKTLLDGMINARNLGSGMDAENQFYYGLTDLGYHTPKDGKVDTTKVAAELFEKVQLYKAPPLVHFQSSFGHLMGYQAGYYSYMWSLVYASDMAVHFKEKGMLNPEAGMDYRRKVIGKGGTRDAIDSLRDYLGREPKLDSFLIHLGLPPETK